MAFDKTLLFVAISLTLSNCWIRSAGANPVPTEDQLDQDDAFKAGKPLTEEEFNSGAIGNKGASMGNRPWEHQVGGDVPPNNGNKNAKKYGDVKWPRGQIPYVISSTFSSEERKTIASAMQDYHKKTCLRFVPRKTQSDYLKIIRSKESQNGWSGYPGCWAQKGHVGGAQELSLDNGCVYFSIVIHELMHAVGFDHEQERPDQSRYITVNFDNIKKENHQWFTPKPKDAVNTIGRYDINSVMHYGAYAFAVDTSIPTMVAKNGKKNMGNGEKGFSSSDVQKINTLYSCSG